MRIIHFKVKNSTFILRDQELLERNFHCRNYLINTSSPIKYAFALIKLSLFLLFAGWSYDAYYIRFADQHTALLAFFKKLYKKKLFIVIGGFDVAAIPQYNYGAHLNKKRSRLIQYALNNATCLLPNSQSMVHYENTFTDKQPVHGGIKHFAPKTKARIEVVPNGFDAEKFKKKSDIKKRNLAITVAVVNNNKTFHMKGIDRFFDTASKLPDYEFLAVGISNTFLKQERIDVPSNMKTIEFTQTDELIKLYSEAKVFCLFSLSEGMPNVLCEAMLCECIPVGTQVTSIPEIIGNAGFIIESPSLKNYAEAVQRAFLANDTLGTAARKRIAENYNSALREEKIVSIMLDEKL